MLCFKDNQELADFLINMSHDINKGGKLIDNDFRKMWIALKHYILTKNSHGKNELLQEMVNIEQKYILGDDNA